jgi:hypothetical protein
MIQHTSEEVEEKVNELYYSATKLKHRYEYTPDRIVLEVSSMYSPPGLSFKILTELVSFFGAKEVDSDSFSQEGCETCDYGSKYGFVLTIT